MVFAGCAPPPGAPACIGGIGRPHVPHAGAFISTAAPQYGHGLVGVAIRDTPRPFEERTVSRRDPPSNEVTAAFVLCRSRGAAACRKRRRTWRCRRASYRGRVGPRV